jgi:uncharacterized membrane protein
MKVKILLWIICALAIVGFINAGFLYYKTGSGQPVPCFVVSGCDIVQNSSYAKLFGVPLALFGVVYYIALVISTAYILLKINTKKIYFNLWFLFIVFGFLFSLYLLYLQAFVIEAFCSWCLISFAEMLIIFTVSISVYYQLRDA